MGYDFPAAIADLIDNSIEARATTVAIDVEFDGDDSWVRIADNGKGMSKRGIMEAMRFGSQRDYEEDDLGKFGLGLKTASLSQCQRLSIASRKSLSTSEVSAFCWDLEHIYKTNRWEILPLERNGLGPQIRKPLNETRGTVVLWQRLDRILGYKQPYGEQARKRLSTMCRELEGHLAMVFHRFLAGEVPRRKLKILLNGNEIRPWDPFCPSEPKTRKLYKIRFPIEHEGIQGEVVLRPFILPHQDDFSSPDSFRAASGPANWNQQQGFYIYRAGRMIQSGGWSNLRAADEHTKLARISIDFSPELDEAFKINVAKMRVQLPAQIRDELRESVSRIVKVARQVYDRKSSRGPSPMAAPVDSATRPPGPASEYPLPASGSPRVSEGNSSEAERLLSFEQWFTMMQETATKQEWPVVEAVLQRVQRGVES